MLSLDSIRTSIVPIPQKVTAGKGEDLKLTPSSKFCLHAPEAEKGPVKTAGENIRAFLTAKCGADCFAEDDWNFMGAGSVEDVNERYVNRHFAPIARKAKHAYKLMELCTEQRTAIKDEEHPAQSVVNTLNMMDHVLSYYFYCYYRNPDHGANPRHFPGEGLKTILEQRTAYERALFSVAAMAKEAAATMRNHSIFMQIFADIAGYIEATDDPKLDLFDITPIMSKENWMLR